MFNADVIQAIAKLAVDAVKPQEYKVTGGRVIIDKEGNIKHLVDSFLPQDHVIDDYQSFMDYVTWRHNQELNSDPMDSVSEEPDGDIINTVYVNGHDGTAVYASRAGLEYREGNADEDVRAKLTWVYSEEYSWISRESSKWFTQKDFIRLMRINLSRCIVDNKIIALLTQVKFNSQVAAESTVERGKQSISRSTLAEVRGTASIPETISLNVRPFENAPFIFPLTCAIEIDETNSTFKLTPMPGELSKVIDLVLEMPEKNCPVKVIRAAVQKRS